MYGKIINYVLRKPVLPLIIDGEEVFDPSHEQYLSQGYKPVIVNSEPESPGNEFEVVPYLEDAEDHIVLAYRFELHDSNDIDEAEAWEIIFGEGDA